jgi:hypothetical protein
MTYGFVTIRHLDHVVGKSERCDLIVNCSSRVVHVAICVRVAFQKGTSCLGFWFSASKMVDGLSVLLAGRMQRNIVRLMRFALAIVAVVSSFRNNHCPRRWTITCPPTGFVVLMVQNYRTLTTLYALVADAVCQRAEGNFPPHHHRHHHLGPRGGWLLSLLFHPIRAGSLRRGRFFLQVTTRQYHTVSSHVVVFVVSRDNRRIL